MLQRTRKPRITPDIGIGPGKVSKLLGLTVADNGLSICSDTLWIEDRDMQITESQIETTPRIGVDYAGEDALLPYRFVWHPER
jgi:DNA-3-methyladenine glycosylase